MSTCYYFYSEFHTQVKKPLLGLNHLLTWTVTWSDLIFA